jgi:redox-sensitive bicupin YhaK (pirin superfamily)
MFGTKLLAASRPPSVSYLADARAQPRRIALLANGRRHGAITRLITPWTIGELTQPFVLLNYAEVVQRSRPLFHHHPPAGVGTLSLVLNGELSFEDASGKRGEVAAAGFAWMKAGGLVWHEGGRALREPLRVFQLGIAQHAAQQNSAVPSEYIAPDEVEEDGPVRVVLGQFGRARSRIRHAPADINCFHVHLKDGEQFRYDAPDGHNVTWLAVDRGGLELQPGERVYWEQIALFGESAGVIEAQAEGETSFVLGSAKERVPDYR